MNWAIAETDPLSLLLGGLQKSGSFFDLCEKLDQLAGDDEIQQQRDPKLAQPALRPVVQIGGQGGGQRRLRLRSRDHDLEKLFLPALAVVQKREQHPRVCSTQN